jgi:prevent-host-death family protein
MKVKTEYPGKGSEFKAKCLAMLDEVASTGEVIVVTKRGRAVARVSAASAREHARFGHVQRLR